MVLSCIMMQVIAFDRTKKRQGVALRKLHEEHVTRTVFHLIELISIVDHERAIEKEVEVHWGGRTAICDCYFW